MFRPISHFVFIQFYCHMFIMFLSERHTSEMNGSVELNLQSYTEKKPWLCFVVNLPGSIYSSTEDIFRSCSLKKRSSKHR